MGEIFDRPAPSQELEWTGERLTSAVSGQIEIEHLHRYFFARTLCRGADVLDVASGEGYGSSLLAQVARSVVGVEIDPVAVTHAARAYSKPNLAFVNGDARSIPLPDASVDVVVSFETLEHFFEHDAFLREVKRVLRPGGRFVISSPDRDVYSPLGSSANPYHVNELTRHEFEQLLANHFSHCAMFLQRPVLGSVLFPEGRAHRVMTFERRGDTHYEASVGVPRAPYNLIVASDSTLDEVQASIFFETSAIGELLTQVEARAENLASFAREREQYEGMLLGIRGELQSAEAGTRSALARAERAEDALNLLASTRNAEVDVIAAGLREELRALSMAQEQTVARAASTELALDMCRANERALREQSDQIIASLREELRQADEAMRGQLNRTVDLEERLSNGLQQADQVIASLRDELRQADEAMRGQLNRTVELEERLSNGLQQADQVIASLRDEVRQAEEAMKGQQSRIAELTFELEQTRSALIAASGHMAPLQRDPDACETAAAPLAESNSGDATDQAELALLRDTVKALKAQIATLQSQKDAAGLSLRIHSAVMQKQRVAWDDDDQHDIANHPSTSEIDIFKEENEKLSAEVEVLRSLFEHTRGSVEGVLRISGARLMPKSTRRWVRRKIYGPRWIG